MQASQLPGGLGAGVNECLRPDEDIIIEVHTSKGEGITLTDMRLIKVVAGMSKAGSISARRHAYVSFNRVRGLRLSRRPGDSDNVSYMLELDSDDIGMPEWVARTVVSARSVGDVFTLYGVLVTRLAEMKLSGQLYAGSSLKAVCPHCDTPYIVATGE
ncbi:MAG: hypothetical protein H7A35_04820 [Planctomycetales bacterium]|nr:hypothetical protein [bacterium]UNM09380.1 MAG: hypothetical protein H7A35_04820 [Planctomycetales bacterium]